jgi:hypothetical protein
MMKKIFLIIALLAPIFCAHAQTKNSYLKVTHVTSGSAVTDEIPFNGGEINILDNAVTITFAANPDENRTFAFDKIVSFAFETRVGAAISTVKEVLLNVAIDESSILHVQSTQAIGAVRVYSITGILIAQTTSTTHVADINLSNAPKGVYVVKVGNYIEKIIKQ